MKQFFSKLFKSSQDEVKNQNKLNFIGLPESEFISDSKEIKSSVKRLIDEMLEFNKEHRKAITNKFQMLDIDFRKKWEHPKMAEIILSNCIFLPEDFPVVLKYLGFTAPTSPYQPTKFYKLKNYYIEQNTIYGMEVDDKKKPYMVYTNETFMLYFPFRVTKLSSRTKKVSNIIFVYPKTCLIL